MTKQETGICVVGGGVAGLMVTRKLSELGYKVTLVEKQPKLATGPSTRNEGWLHAGGYHAGLYDDEEKAKEVVGQIHYGREQILRIAPECVEEPSVSTYALFRDERLAARAERRYKDLEVRHNHLTRSELEREAPEIDHSQVSHAYEMADRSVNFRLLYQKLLASSERAGATVLTGTTLIPEDENKAMLESADGSRTSLSADIFICTTGLGTKAMLEGKSELAERIRFWKSHSLIFPRLTKHGMYYIDPQEASLMHHGDYSIGCQSEDDFVVKEPTFEVIKEPAMEVYKAVRRLVPGAANHRDVFIATSCIKPDIAPKLGMERSVNNEIHEPLPNYLVAFPGKVTTSPLMADKLVHAVFNRHADDRISLRPGDAVEFGR
jgi:glycerol-3-phosphate dehydrogenase